MCEPFKKSKWIQDKYLIPLFENYVAFSCHQIGKNMFAMTRSLRKYETSNVAILPQKFTFTFNVEQL